MKKSIPSWQVLSYHTAVNNEIPNIEHVIRYKKSGHRFTPDVFEHGILQLLWKER
jgi:hypothetical protein